MTGSPPTHADAIEATQRHDRPSFDHYMPTHEVLVGIANLLEEILSELRRGNAIERTGAVSSVQIEDRPTKDLPVRVTSKVYAGSPLPVDEALEDHARLHREAERRAMDGWAEAIDAAQHMRLNGCEMQVDGPGAWHWKHSETCLSRHES